MMFPTKQQAIIPTQALKQFLFPLSSTLVNSPSMCEFPRNPIVNKNYRNGFGSASKQLIMHSFLKNIKHFTQNIINVNKNNAGQILTNNE